MSFETSTNQSTFRPWHFFVLVALAAATMAVLMSRSTVVGTLLLSVVIGSAALVGVALLRTLQPLVNDDLADEPVLVGQRTRLAVEREKSLVLRSIKELEFDRAMNKVSEVDFEEMTKRLRTRAMNLLGQLESDKSGYRELIERELETRLADLSRSEKLESKSDAPVDGCAECGTSNDADARFCKACGARLS